MIKKTFIIFSYILFTSLSGVGIGVPPPAAAAVQPAQQAPSANMQPQATSQHQQLLMKQQQASAFLSPQSTQQVGRLLEQDWKWWLAALCAVSWMALNNAVHAWWDILLPLFSKNLQHQGVFIKCIFTVQAIRRRVWYHTKGLGLMMRQT